MNDISYNVNDDNFNPINSVVTLSPFLSNPSSNHCVYFHAPDKLIVSFAKCRSRCRYRKYYSSVHGISVSVPILSTSVHSILASIYIILPPFIDIFASVHLFVHAQYSASIHKYSYLESQYFCLCS